jgi:hypothetical protein
LFIVGPYLFSGDELDLYLKDRKAEAVAAARGGDASGEGAAVAPGDRVRALYEKFQIAETQMHIGQACFSGERPLNDEECEAIAVKDEDRDTYKAITITIPYSGDSHLFTCQPTVYSANQPQAEVKDGVLHMTWFLAEVEESQLENNFKRQIALIERTLEVTQWQAMGCNQEMMAALKAEVIGAADAGG